MGVFRELFNADIKRYGRKPDAYIKVFHFLYRKASTSSFAPMKIVYKALFRFWSNLHGIEITANQLIRGGLYLGHAYNITINPEARIGYNCNIHKGIVIGQANRGLHKGVPTIGNEVWIGINAAVVGGITIGDDVLIAPNSYVNVDVPSHSVVFGNPCIIKHRDWATEGYINHKVERNYD